MDLILIMQQDSGMSMQPKDLTEVSYTGVQSRSKESYVIYYAVLFKSRQQRKSALLEGL